MTRAGGFLAAAAAAVLVAAAAADDKPAAVGGELKALDRRVMQAAQTRDTDFLNRHVGDDYVLTDPTGMVWDKKQVVAAVREGGLRFERITDSDVKAQPLGDSAVLTGRTELKGRQGEQDVSGPYRFTRVYTKRDGRWQCVAQQITRILKP